MTIVKEKEKPYGSIYSNSLFRAIGNIIAGLVAHTGITPEHLTFLNLFFGIVAALLAILAGSYLTVETLWYFGHRFAAIHEWGVSPDGIRVKFLVFYPFAGIAAVYFYLRYVPRRRYVRKKSASESEDCK